MLACRRTFCVHCKAVKSSESKVKMRVKKGGGVSGSVKEYTKNCAEKKNHEWRFGCVGSKASFIPSISNRYTKELLKKI